MKFFEHLDKKGGFYYEVVYSFLSATSLSHIFFFQRWGDAPVHSIGAALLAKKEQIHFFNDIGEFFMNIHWKFISDIRKGYRHNPFQHCPQGESHKKGKCWCNPKDNFDYEWYSCLTRYDKLF